MALKRFFFLWYSWELPKNQSQRADNIWGFPLSTPLRNVRFTQRRKNYYGDEEKPLMAVSKGSGLGR
jgi:hypothetical protein